MIATSPGLEARITSARHPTRCYGHLMGETATVLTAPVMAPEGRRFRPRAWGLALIGVIAVATAGNPIWSISSGYGGVDADGGWIDAAGDPVATAPLTVDAQGHTAPAALAALLLVVVVGVFLPPVLARRGHVALGEILRWVAYAAVPVIIVVGTLVYTVWQSDVVLDQVNRQVLEPHGFPWGGVSVTIGHMTR